MLKKNNQLLFLLVFYLFFKIFTILVLNIYTIPGDLGVRWQILSVNVLESDLLGSLYNLHYQPPFWNLIYGIFVKIFGKDFNVLSNCIHGLNILISFFSIYYFYLVCLLLKLDNLKITITFLIFFILSPGYLFYETISHYTHLTTLLFAQLVYYYLKFTGNRSVRYEIRIYAVSLVLVYTWTAFSHPLFILTIFLGIIFIKYKDNFFRSFLIFIISAIISILPSIKNKIKFDVFSNSTWTGLQIIQVLQDWDNFDKCNFNIKDRTKEEENFKKKYPNLNIEHPSLTGRFSGYNHVAFIEIAKMCTKIGINQIKNDPLYYLSKVKFNFISTHGHYSFDHVGWEPNNWNDYFVFFSNLKENKITNQIKVRSIQFYYFIMYLFFLFLILRNLYTFTKKERYLHKGLCAISFIFFWLILVIHFFAGFEQERMRHTGHFLHIIFFVVILQNNFNLRKIYRNFF